MNYIHIIYINGFCYLRLYIVSSIDSIRGWNNVFVLFVDHLMIIMICRVVCRHFALRNLQSLLRFILYWDHYCYYFMRFTVFIIIVMVGFLMMIVLNIQYLFNSFCWCNLMGLSIPNLHPLIIMNFIDDKIFF